MDRSLFQRRTNRRHERRAHTLMSWPSILQARQDNPRDFDAYRISTLIEHSLLGSNFLQKHSWIGVLEAFLR